MKKTVLFLSSVTVTATLFLIACSGGAKSNNPQPISQDSLVKRGDYLVTTMGCDDCHTTKKMGAQGPELDLEHRFAGHLATSPLGKADMSVMKNGWA